MTISIGKIADKSRVVPICLVLLIGIIGIIAQFLIAAFFPKKQGCVALSGNCGRRDTQMMRDLFYGVSEQAKAGKHRMDDARALLNAVRWRGAMYLAGYSVECLLKTKLMRMFECRHMRELEEVLQRRDLITVQTTVFTHQLELLLRLTNAIDRLRQNREQWQMFNLVNRWVPAWRYSADLSNRDDATDFLDAVESVLRWIDHNV